MSSMDALVGLVKATLCFQDGALLLCPLEERNLVVLTWWEEERQASQMLHESHSGGALVPYHL
jgi:hypothetical protein